MSSRTASRSSRKNLWKTKVIEDKYETDLRRCSAAFRRCALELLPKYMRTGDDGKPYVEMEAFAAELNRVLASEVETTSQDIKADADLVFRRGILLAETSARGAQ